MAAFRPIGTRGMSEETLAAGDLELVSGLAGTNTVAGASTLTGAQLVTGYLFRSGSVAGYIDTFDTSANILAAMAGNGYAPAVVPGLGFTCRIVNTVAFAETLTLGTGMVAGSGSIGSVAASSWRDFLFSFTNVQPLVTLIANTTNGSAVVTWTLPTGMTALQEGPAVTASNVTVGATVTGTGIPAGTTVLGITQGMGGTLGITLSANATATNSNVALTFSSTITVNSTGSGTL